MLKYTNDFISFCVINTALSLRDGMEAPNLMERVTSDQARELGIIKSEKVQKKKKPDQRILAMQNQISMKILINDRGEERNVHIMLFCNYSITVTGVTRKKHAQLATRKLLKILPELEHNKQFKIQATTLHYSLGFQVQPYETAQILQKCLPPGYIVSYRSDVGAGRTVRIQYAYETPDSNTFILQRSGKIMQSIRDTKRIKYHFKILMEAMFTNRSVIENRPQKVIAISSDEE